ncbi:MAG TPA: hypothetical protein VI006_27170 [Solirubrobacteraceae bacterium]
MPRRQPSRWAARFAGRRIEVAVEACTGWFVCDALAATGALAQLAEPVQTRALRGHKRRAKPSARTRAGCASCWLTTGCRRRGCRPSTYVRGGHGRGCGPKYWASEELVCARTLAGRLAPGDEGSRYGSNPGEAWAETYAQVSYPGVAWSVHPAARPTAASLAAARKDVLTPWTGPRTTTFRGALGPSATRRSFRIRPHLDGEARFRLHGPARANYDLRISSGAGS